MSGWTRGKVEEWANTNKINVTYSEVRSTTVQAGYVVAVEPAAGKEVFRRENEDFPVTKQKIMMNAWPGKGVDEWLSPFDDLDLPLTAEYKSIKYTPFTE